MQLSAFTKEWKLVTHIMHKVTGHPSHLIAEQAHREQLHWKSVYSVYAEDLLYMHLCAYGDFIDNAPDVRQHEMQLSAGIKDRKSSSPRRDKHEACSRNIQP